MTLALFSFACRDNIHVWLFTVKVTVYFDNGEVRQVDIRKVEPEADDFEAPEVGSRVCCNVGGGKYSAVIMEITSIASKVFTHYFCFDF